MWRFERTNHATLEGDYDYGMVLRSEIELMVVADNANDTHGRMDCCWTLSARDRAGEMEAPGRVGMKTLFEECR